MEMAMGEMATVTVERRINELELDHRIIKAKVEEIESEIVIDPDEGARWLANALTEDYSVTGKVYPVDKLNGENKNQH